MIYSNSEYFLLLALTAMTYALVRHQTGRVGLLLMASTVFYLWAGLGDFLCFLGITLIGWFAIQLSEIHPQRRSLYIACALSLMIGNLFYFKYAAWLGGELDLIGPGFRVGLPIGISFFTLQGIAYLVDYRRRQAPVPSLTHYLLFKGFFAQLVAGPICRVEQLLPQLQKLRSANGVDIRQGLSFFVLGFFKKVFIADRIAPHVEAAFNAPESHGQINLIIAAIAYSIQIWGDFSGYTDMGRGSARLLGIQLPENFLSPYLATSPSEFWKRWHITLSQWIRDYIYIPLGGNRAHPLRVHFNLILAFSLSGIWHGANWTFLLWGVFHGMILGLEKISRWHRSTPLALRIAGTYLCVVFGWILFRAHSLENFCLYLNNMVFGSVTHKPVSIGLMVYISLGFLIQIVSELSRNGSLSRFRFATSPTWQFGYGILVGLVLLVALAFRPSDIATAFIYFEF